MIALNNIKSSVWSRQTSKRLGRWNGSGKGTYSGRWMNGQNSRSGGGTPDWFEGGQTPLFRRMPKLKGFSNAIFKTEYNIINIGQLSLLAQKWINVIDKDVLLANKIIRKKSLPIKLLWNGTLSEKISVTIDKASVSAKEAVEKAGGTLILK